jgi:hypothetical protein
MNCRTFLTVGLLGCLVAAVSSAAPAAKFSGTEPVLITSAGQSADVLILKTLFTRSGLAPKVNALAKADDLAGIKTLVVAIGGSAKGLGAAGIDAPKERARIAALLAKAKAAGIPVLGMHIGGQSKRGELSDEFFTQVASAAAFLVIVKEGDADGFMAGAAAKAKVGHVYVEKLTAVSGAIKEIFGKN